jgi:hypothetical protein
MEQHADVIPRDADLAAYLILFPLLQEDRSQDGTVAFRQFFKHLADHPACVIRNDLSQGIWFVRDKVIRGLLIEGFDSTVGAKMLGEHMIANGVHQWAEALGIADATLASQKLQAASKGFLLHVLYRLSGSQPGAQFQRD